MFPSCDNNREDLSRTKIISPSNNERKLKPILGIALTVIASLGSGVYLWQKFKPCPKGQEKLNGICSVAYVSESSDSTSGSSTNQTNLYQFSKVTREIRH